MKFLRAILIKTPAANRYRYQIIVLIAVGWALLDVLYLLARLNIRGLSEEQNIFDYTPLRAVFLRAVIVLIMSGIMASLLLFPAPANIEKTLILSFFLRTIWLFSLALFMNFLIHLSYSLLIMQNSFQASLQNFVQDAFYTPWLLEKVPEWLLIFVLLQLVIEMIKKYSPGIFLDVLFGKYRHPKVENRIIMFIDLKDSTPIAEKLGHVDYFKFIRRFINYVSAALIQHNGRIYQYVGDEIVVSWLCTPNNAKRCIDALIETRKLLQKNGEGFRRDFGIIPEFRVGIHIGEVTVGEIGIIKKDLAMSGDTMNTTARIRSACSELNQKFIVSKDVIDTLDLKDWQSESLGLIDLKGKNAGIELFALKI
jgi:adenylate cyclase